MSKKTKRAYQYRFSPTPEQKSMLAQTLGCVRFVYNWGLSTRKTAYFQQGQSLSYHDLATRLPDLKKQSPWLAEVSRVPLQQALRHLDAAYMNFFEGRTNSPTFKKKQYDQSATSASNAFKWEGGALTQALMNTPLDIHWHRPLPKGAKPSSVTICKESANRYFVSILVEEDIKPKPLVIKIDQWYPSSKTCHACKHVLDSLTLDRREWICPECGVVHDRDTNAAKNILAEVLSVAACGGSARPVRAKARRATPREAGNSPS